MIAKKFATYDKALDYLIDNKKEECAEKLADLFNLARDEGLDPTFAVNKAALLHSYFDHGHGQEIPDFFNPTTDEEVEAVLTEGEQPTREIPDLIIKHYRALRSWGINIFLASKTAIDFAEWEWYQDPAHNEKEDDVRADIQKIEDVHIRAIALQTFEENLSEAGVHFAAKASEKVANDAQKLVMITALLSQSKGSLLN